MKRTLCTAVLTLMLVPVCTAKTAGSGASMTVASSTSTHKPNVIVRIWNAWADHCDRVSSYHYCEYNKSIERSTNGWQHRNGNVQTCEAILKR
jgi:hypothetical protein